MLEARKIRRFGRVSAFFIVLAGVAGGPSSAKPEPQSPASSAVLGALTLSDFKEPLTDAQRHRLAALIYERFVEVMTWSGYTVAISTSEAETIRSDRFSTFRALDAQSYDSPKRLNVTPITRSLNGVVQGVTYRPEWQATPDNPTAEEGATATLSDSLAESAQFIENFELPLAMTTVRVHLEFAGEAMTYRATVSWLKPDGNGMARFRADDVNIQFLNEAFAENRRVWAGARSNKADPEPVHR